MIVGRSAQKTQSLATELGVDFYIADFASLDQVRELAAALDGAYPRIDVLVNNAGGIFGSREKTVDGHEQTFQVNHLAPFLLTTLLMDKLVASGASIIQTSSSAARALGNLDIDDLDLDKNFSASRAYGTSKLQNILFTKELTTRFGEQGISAAAFHPGVVATSFAKDSSSFMKHFVRLAPVRVFMKSPQGGATQLVWLAEGTPGKDWVSGVYYEKQLPTRSHKQANDPELARELWDRSEALIAASAPTA